LESSNYQKHLIVDTLCICC